MKKAALTVLIALLAVLIHAQTKVEQLTIAKQKSDSINLTKNWQLIKHNLYLANNGDIGFKSVEYTGEGITIVNYVCTFFQSELQLKDKIDTSSFISVGNQFFKDKKHVYLKRNIGGGSWFEILNKLKSKDFDTLGYCFGKDKKHVYSNQIGKLENVSPENFQAQEGCYYKIGNNYFQNNQPVTESEYFNFKYSYIHNYTYKPKGNGITIKKVSDNFYVYTTFRALDDGQLFSSNGMYVLTDRAVLLFDTPWDTTQFFPLLDSIWKKHEKSVSFCMPTHSHDDRTAGLVYFKKVKIPTYSTKRIHENSLLKGEKVAEYRISEDTIITIDGVTFEIYYPGPGHAPDNIVVWFPKEKVLYGGCFVKSVSSKSLGNLEDADTKEWLKSLNKVIEKFPNPNFVITGHQSFESTKALKHSQKLLKKFNRKHE